MAFTFIFLADFSGKSSIAIMILSAFSPWPYIFMVAESLCCCYGFLSSLSNVESADRASEIINTIRNNPP